MEVLQKTQEDWQKEYDNGELTPRDLWDAGFRPRSNKFLAAVKEWKYYKKYYKVCLTLSKEEYYQLKCCLFEIEREKAEEAERAEYRRFLYLQNKYGN